MQNQYQFLRKTAAFLRAFAIIASLLSSFAAAQNLPTMEERAAWLIEQCRGESIKPNAKHGPAVALALGWWSGGGIWYVLEMYFGLVGGGLGP